MNMSERKKRGGGGGGGILGTTSYGEISGANTKSNKQRGREKAVTPEPALS